MKNKPESVLVVPLVKVLSGFIHLRVVDRWLAAPERARYSASIAFLR